jgi:hypothetical protein
MSTINRRDLPEPVTVAQLASANALKVTGDAAGCDRVLELFDKFDPATNTLIPLINIGRH